MTRLINPETLAALRDLDGLGKSGFLAEIVNAYLADTAVRLQDLWTAQKAGKAEVIAKAAHSIKGSSLNVGADTFAALMQSIESDAKDGSVGTPERLRDAEALFGLIRHELESYLA